MTKFSLLFQNMKHVSNVFFLGQELPMLKSGLLPHSRQAPVYVWSPVISQCSKSCGNGKLKIIPTMTQKKAFPHQIRSTKAWCLCRNPAGVVFLCGPPDQTGGVQLPLWCFYPTSSSVWDLQHISLPPYVRHDTWHAYNIFIYFIMQ